ncbi:MAG: lipopolysaccharide biosynthesis protein [Candidatus Hodarchaeota archaeon]
MLLGEIKKLGKHSIVYGFGNLFTNLLGVILLPIYTRYLTPADYGIFSLLIITGTIVGIITQLGLGSALFREVIYQGSDERIVQSTAFYFLIGESILFFSIVIIFSPHLSRLIFKSLNYAYLLRLIFLTGILNSLNIVIMAKFRIHGRSLLYSSLALARLVIGATITIYFIVVLKRGVEGLVTAGLILAAIFGFIYFLFLLKDFRLTFSMKVLRRLLNFGIPLVPFGLARIIMGTADRYFLQHLSTTTNVGLYSVAYRVGLAINLIVGAVQLAWPAQMYKIAKQPRAEQQLSKILTYYLFALSFIGLGFSVLAYEILVIMTTPQFYSAYTVVPLIVISYIMYGVMYMTNSALETQNKTRYMFPTIIVAACINLLLNYFLIPHFGIMGAGLAAVAAYTVLAMIQLAVNLHFWYIPYEYKRIVKIALVWIFIYGCSFLIKTTNFWITCGLKLLLLGTYPLLLYAIRFYTKQELARFTQLLSGIRRKHS